MFCFLYFLFAVSHTRGFTAHRQYQRLSTSTTSILSTGISNQKIYSQTHQAISRQYNAQFSMLWLLSMVAGIGLLLLDFSNNQLSNFFIYQCQWSCGLLRLASGSQLIQVTGSLCERIIFSEMQPGHLSMKIHEDIIATTGQIFKTVFYIIIAPHIQVILGTLSAHMLENFPFRARNILVSNTQPISALLIK